MGSYERIEPCPACKKDIMVLDCWEELGNERKCPYCDISIVLEYDEFVSEEGDEFPSWNFIQEN